MIRAVAAVLALLALGMFLFQASACATAGFKDAPDSGGVKFCSQDPLVFCDAGAPGPSCTVGTMETDPRLMRLTPGTYPDKCVVNYLGTGHDDNGDCILMSVCKCEDRAQDAAAPPVWVCGP